MNTRYSNNPDEESICNQLSFESMEQNTIETHNEIAQNTQLFMRPSGIPDGTV